MRKQLFYLLVFVGISYCISACSADKLPPPAPATLQCEQVDITYDKHIQGILNAKCNVSGCHDDNAMGRFGDYNTLSPQRRENIFNRAVTMKNMPPQGMDSEYRDSISCWAKQGYLQN